jgi:hypothetical protein
MSSHQAKRDRDEALLISAAESIGSTLGAIAAKVSVVPRALSHSSVVQAAEREGKKFVRKGKSVARKIKKAAVMNAKKSSKLRKTTRRGLRRTTTAAKRVVRSVSASKKTARLERNKK